MKTTEIPLKIMQALHLNPDQSVEELCSQFDLGHLRVAAMLLRMCRGGLLVRKRHGHQYLYSINDEIEPSTEFSTSKQKILLALSKSSEPMTQKEIANSIGISQGYTSVVINCFMSRNLVKIVRVFKNNRRVWAYQVVNQFKGTQS